MGCKHINILIVRETTVPALNDGAFSSLVSIYYECADCGQVLNIKSIKGKERLKMNQNIKTKHYGNKM